MATPRLTTSIAFLALFTTFAAAEMPPPGTTVTLFTILATRYFVNSRLRPILAAAYADRDTLYLQISYKLL